MLLCEQKGKTFGPSVLIINRSIPPEEGEKTHDGPLPHITVGILVESFVNHDIRKLRDELCKADVTKSGESKAFTDFVAAV